MNRGFFEGGEPQLFVTARRMPLGFSHGEIPERIGGTRRERVARGQLEWKSWTDGTSGLTRARNRKSFPGGRTWDAANAGNGYERKDVLIRVFERRERKADVEK